MAAPQTSTPASLADWLRSRTDEDLAELLRRRPDLALPAPADLTALASRVGVRTSVQRAVDSLDELSLRALEAISLDADPTGLAAVLGGAVTADDAARALSDLRSLGLVWGLDDALHLLPSVPDALGAYPAGLGRPAGQLLRSTSDVVLGRVLRELGLPPATQPRSGAAVADVLRDPLQLDALLAACTPPERDVLARLAAGPPVGGVRGGQLPIELATATPPQRLIARGLLIPIEAQTVELPREVGLRVRGDSPLGLVRPVPPAIPVVQREPESADRTGTTAVLELIRLVDALAAEWEHLPPVVLRSGGLGVRELRRTAKALGLDEPAAALLAELASAAGLVGPTSGIDPVFLPTGELDIWRRSRPAERWSLLASTWLTMTRQPSLIGQRGERDRVVAALSPDAERGAVPGLRTAVLDVFAELPPGAAPADPVDVLTRLAWRAPRRAALQQSSAEAVITEAATVGIVAGALTSYGRALLSGSTRAAEQQLDAALPEPVGYVLVQPDLTVVVPGPPEPALAAELAAAADLESSGGASVYRVTETTLRRALDSGRTGAGLSAMFAERSRTPIPQALSYLIDDVARRHGVLRSGPASAYLRCDDEALLSRVVGDRSVAALGLRQIAPTVLVSQVNTARLLDVLRDAGYAPAAEAPDGALVTLLTERPRAPSRPPGRAVRPRVVADASAALRELVRRVRSGDALAQMSRHLTPVGQRVPGVTTAATLSLLREAIRGSRTIWLGYVDADGTSSQHTILPISLAGGTLRGHERESAQLRSFPLHRITAVSVLSDEQPTGAVAGDVVTDWDNGQRE